MQMPEDLLNRKEMEAVKNPEAQDF